MHTFVYQIEQSVIEHFERISLYTKSFYTEIRLYVYLIMAPCFDDVRGIHSIYMTIDAQLFTTIAPCFIYPFLEL